MLYANTYLKPLNMLLINTSMKCKWPLNHVSISTTGKIRPCCAWDEDHDGKQSVIQPNYSNTTLAEYAESDFMKNLVNELRNGRFGSGCRECYLDEKIGHRGMYVAGDKKYSQTEIFSPIDCEIKFGNLCNAGCIMCSEYNSSLLEQENAKNPELEDFRAFLNLKKDNWWEDEAKFNSLAKEVSGYEKIRFTGGEPTVRGLLRKFLTEVAKYNTDIKIQITSNGSNINDRLIDQLRLFREVEFNLSIDGYGAANDFIRWPLKWEDINRSIDKIQTLDNYDIIVETSLQVCSLSSLSDLVAWTRARQVSWNCNAVYGPAHLQPSLASDEVKDMARSISGIDIEKFLNFNSSDQDLQKLREKCIRYLDTLDKVRGTNWRSIIKI